jgi:hypothetical protein
MEFFGFVFSGLALAVALVLLLVLIVGCAFDRRGQHASVKWWTFAVIAILGAAWQFDGIKTALTDGDWVGVVFNPGFWKTVGIYAGAGVLYSILEMAITVRKSRTYMADVWANFQKRWNTEQGAMEAAREAGKPAQSVFVDYYGSTRYAFVGLELKDGKIEPKLNRTSLSGHITTWTLFWPAYAISMIFGDLIVEIFNTIADFLASISGRAVRRFFSGTFE